MVLRAWSPNPWEALRFSGKGEEAGYGANLGHCGSPGPGKGPGAGIVMSPRKLALVRILAGSLIVLALVIGAVWVFALSDEDASLAGLALSAAEVEARIRSWGAWGVAGSIGLMVLHSFVPFPAEIVALANGMVYGLVWGTVITWTGALLGAYLAFGLSRWLGRPFVMAMVARRHRTVVDRWAQRQGGHALLISRLIPVISFNLINYAAGLTRISWWTFSWATGIGIFPLTFLMVAMGAGLTAGAGGAWFWLPFLAVAGLALWGLMRQDDTRQLLAAGWRRLAKLAIATADYRFRHTRRNLADRRE